MVFSVNTPQNKFSIEEANRLDAIVNPNAQASYIKSDDTFEAFKSMGKSIEDFTFAKNTALLKLHARPMLPTPKPASPYYVENDGTEETSDTEATSESEGSETTYAALSVNGDESTEATSSANNSGNQDIDVEQQAINAAEEVMNKAEETAESLKNGNWEKEEGGYKYIDPQFYVEYEKLMGYFNVLQLLGTIIDALQGLKEFILKTRFVKEAPQGGSESSASETLAMARETGMLMGQSQILELTESVNTYNRDILKQRLTQARRRANDEGYTAWSVTCDLASSGSAKASERNCDYVYYKTAHKIISNYEKFQDRVTSLYEKTLSQSKLYQDGLTNIGSQFANITKDSLQFDIGSGKVDIKREAIFKTQTQVNSLENYRRIYLMYRAALKEIKSMVVETTTGIEFSGGTKEVLSEMVDSLEKFDNLCFSALAQQLQSNIYWTNTEQDAYVTMKEAKYLRNSAYSVGWVPLLGGLFRCVGDWIAMEAFNANYSFSSNPSQLTQSQINSILSEVYSNSSKELRNTITREDEYIAKLEAMEEREWKIIGQLTEDEIVYTGSDGYKGIREERINTLRENLTAVQNAERLLIMLVEGTNRLKQIMLKIRLGVGDVETAKDAQSSLSVGLQGRLLAFDLKRAGIKNKVDAHNTKLKQQEMLTKARWVGPLAIVGIGVAILLIVLAVYCPPSAVLAIGFISAMGQLFASIGNIIFNLTHDIDDSMHEQVNFYEQVGKRQDEIDKKYNAQIDSLNQNSHILADDGAAIFADGDMWAMDTAAFMGVRNELTKIYIDEQLLNMYIKGMQDIKNSVVAGWTGIYTGSDFGAVRETSSARFSNKINAYSLKKDMVQDIISRHNLALQQESELNWAIVQAFISAASIACSGLAQGLDGLSQAATQAFEWTGFGFDMAGMGLSGLQSGLEAYSGYGELDEFKRIQEMIDTLVENSFYSEGSNFLREALTGINNKDILTDVGRGHVIADSSKYYENVRQIQSLYNRLIFMYRVKDAIGRIKARIAKAPSPYGVSETFEAAKANYEEQLGLLQERVETYVERYNAKVDAERAFILSLVMIAVTVLLKVAQNNGWIKELKKSLNEVLGTDNPDLEAKVSGSKTRAFISEALTGNSDAWNGTIGVSDLVNVLIDLTLNPATTRYIVQAIYDSAKKGDKKAEKADESSLGHSSGKLDDIENQKYESQLRLAEMEKTFAKLGLELENSLELFNYINSVIEATVKSMVDDTWDKAASIIKGSEETVVDPDSGKVSIAPADIDLVSPGKAITDAAKAIGEMDVSQDEKRVAVAGAAGVIVDKAKADPAKVEEAVKSLSAFVHNQLASPNYDPEAVNIALTALSMLSKGNEAHEQTAKQCITNVWQKVDNIETANEITANSEKYYPEQVAASRMAAVISRDKPPAALEQILSLDQSQPVDQALNPKPEDISPAAAVAAAQFIMANQQVKSQALEKLEYVVKTTSNKALLDYAQAVLARVKASSVENQETAETEAAQAVKANQSVIITQKIHARAETIRTIAADGRDIGEHLNALKQDLITLVRLQDTRQLGIDITAFIEQVNKAETLEQVNGLLQSLLGNDEFKKAITKQGVDHLAKAIELLKDAEKAQHSTQKTSQVNDKLEDYRGQVMSALAAMENNNSSDFNVALRKQLRSNGRVSIVENTEAHEMFARVDSVSHENKDNGHGRQDNNQQDQVWQRTAKKTQELIDSTKHQLT